ncbi:hypothetical protein DFR33_106234 [Bradymonas sediminis]|nr:hypothetical protein DFR33_106234 [Bradymonas sediminis]
MRALIYEILGLIFVASTMVFFYQCIMFLAEKDYIAGFATLAIGFIVLRGGIEMGKMALLLRRERSA